MSKEKTIHQSVTRRFARTAIALAMGAAGLLAQAAEVSWTGGTGNWANAERWSPHVPTSFVDVLIGGDNGPDADVAISKGLRASVQNLTVGTSGTLAVYGGLGIAGNLVSTGQLLFGESQARAGTSTVFGNILLGGNGTTTLNGSATLASLGKLVIEAGHTLAGTIGTIRAASIENRGTIVASNLLTLNGESVDAGKIKNSGLIQVNGGANLDAQFYSIDNTGGVIDVVQGRVLSDGVSGGTVRGHGTASLIDGFFGNATLEGSLQSNGLAIGGEVANNAVLTLTRPDGSESYLSGSGNGTLTGRGEVRSFDEAPAVVSAMTFGAGQTFRGSAVIKGGLTNHGSFIVQGSKGLAIDYWTTTWTNDGLIRVTEGSVLRLDRSELNNQGGQLVLEGGSTLVSGGKIVGGTLSASKSTSLQGKVNLQDVELKGDWQTSSNFVLGVTGNIRVAGSLVIGDAPSLSYSSYLYLRGNTTFSGPGETVLNGGPTRSSYIATEWPYDSPVSLLTIDTDHTVRGNGTIAVNTLNKGLLFADVPNGALQIHATLTNAGTLRVAKGAGVLAAADIDNRGGFIDIADGGSLRVYNGRLDGGVIHGQGNASAIGVFDLHDATLTGRVGVSDWTLFGTNGSLGISGTVSNRGVLLVGGVNPDGNTRGNVIVRGTTTLQGEGRTELRGNGALFGESRSARLIVAADHTVAGSGLIGDLALTNRGKLDVQDDGIRAIRMLGFANEGQITVRQGSRLEADVRIVQTGDGSSLRVDGRLQTPGLDLQGGVLSGSGELMGDLNVGAATLRVGGADGTLRIKGHYASGADSTLFLDLSSASALEAPWFVGGDASLSGLLILSFGADAKWDDGLTILSSGGDITGTFSALQVLGSDEKWVLSYFKDHVTVSLASSVPEPSTWMLLGIGLLAVGMRCRRGAQPVAGA